MHRRSFLKAGIAASALAVRGPLAHAAPLLQDEAGWRTFEVVSRVEIQGASGPSQAWLPLPSVDAPAWIRNLGEEWSGNADALDVVADAKYGARMLHAEWQSGQEPPLLEVRTRVSTRNRATEFALRDSSAFLRPRERALYTSPTTLIPTNGIVKSTADAIVGDARTDADKARMLYDWMVEHTARNPNTRGCGLGNIRFMLESGDLTGKCADLNALYVGLCRSQGIPARDVYGIRVAESALGYRSLGRKGDISTAQHCRAEVWLDDYGWVPVDPADVAKVILEEKPGLTLDAPLVQDVRARLFGSWEMNWIAYNTAHDIALPGSDIAPLPFLMYPQAQVGGRHLDGLDPEGFRYALTAAEIGA